MEQITPMKGVFNAPQAAERNGNHYAIHPEPEIGAIALATIEAADTAPGPPVAAPLESQRPVPYRRETSPETVALVRDAQAGNVEAFGELYRQHLDAVTRYVTARMRDKDRDAIPDLVHDAFYEALANLPSAPDDVTGWLFRLAAKACTRHEWSNRRYVRAALTVGETAQRITAADNYATEAPPNIGHIPYAHALARLAPDQRLAIQLRYHEEYPRDLAAELMGRTRDAMKHLEYRALRNLRQALAWTALQGSSIETPTTA